MPELIHQLISRASHHHPDKSAVLYGNETYTYSALQEQVMRVAQGLRHIGLAGDDRVAVFLPKQPECVVSIFATAAAGGVFVPVNPLLKPLQVSHILKDSGARILVTSTQRFDRLFEVLHECPDLQSVVIVDDQQPRYRDNTHFSLTHWSQLLSGDSRQFPAGRISSDMAAIFYTSGSTGKPRGVVVSHRNLVAGAKSVASYLESSCDDRVATALPLSFDAGFSQLTTMFYMGGSVVLMDYLLPRDLLRTMEKHNVTGLAAVPAIWNKLAHMEWPPDAVSSLRFITNTGGVLPTTVTRKLRIVLPNTRIYLMYGLTEAFRSTFLPPDQVDIRPDSIGKAIPEAKIHVLNELGQECAAEEPGELVHRGPLVTLGYWNDPEKTAERFRPFPGQNPRLCLAEIAVWSGDRVRRDTEGFLYFIGRMDNMIKTSGYRVSPTEVEEVLYASGLAGECVALGCPHPQLGQAILAIVSPREPMTETEMKARIVEYCRRELPNYMVPLDIVLLDQVPINHNGKPDRVSLSSRFSTHFERC